MRITILSYVSYVIINLYGTHILQNAQISAIRSHVYEMLALALGD